MAKITVDGKEYDEADLSDDAKQQIANIRIVDKRIAELQRDLSIAKTARGAYIRELQSAMPQDA